ncbi:uncharacterized protein LOC108625054 isoform X2 [Ceratina calcarata]|uniref:Uncharacterized protein LOC108625054 isoform X2 n=1 Tax=Ceratina calcarata TaxID=156304 RepID=A0AAJ7IZA6_9HYME|nr:uncharacterized protein LOC108625054 isoform X2 [Ceratina calcarata]
MPLILSSNPREWLNVDHYKALKTQHELVDEWEPTREVFPLKYGDYMVAMCAGISGVSINSIFRKKMKLQQKGAVFTTFFLTLGPAFVAYICHREYVTNKILLYQARCSLCEELKAVSMISATGFVYPMIVSSAINLAIAGNMGYRIPYIYEVRELATFFWSVLKPQSRVLAVLLLGNALIASTVTYKQLRSMQLVSDILIKVQPYLEDEKEIDR